MKILIQTFLLCMIAAQLQAQCEEQDYIALRALYLNTQGDNWTDNTNWPDSVFFEMNPTIPTGTDLSTWYGVTTNAEGCVICIDMDGNPNCTWEAENGNNLNGSIPPDLGNLSYLERLSLRDNQLIGTIPPNLGQLSHLIELDLVRNNLSGNIPPEIANLSQLTELDLGANDFVGNIPPELGNLSNLILFNLSYNELTGTIPPELSNLSTLEKLWLNGNQLNDAIPPELSNLNNLTELYLFENQLSGNIPPEIGDLSQLRKLNLHKNQLDGSIPSEIGDLSNLVLLNLSDNQLSACYDPNLSNLCNQLNPLYNSNEFVSDGNDFDIAWEDFCAMGTCDTNLVLPGDCNNDSMVDGKDVLYLAEAYGYNGAVRPNATIDWTPQAAPDWNNSVNGINSKHQDANGDGTVDTLDVEVLAANFGNTYGDTPHEQNPTEAIFVAEALADNASNEMRIGVGIASDTPISARSMSVAIDLSAIDHNNIQIDTSGSSLQPDTYFYINNNGILHIALTRADNSDQIIDDGTLFVVIVRDLPSFAPPEINISGGYSMSTDGLVEIGGSSLDGGAEARASSGHTFSENLINSSGANVRLDYTLVQDGTIDISLYSIHGQQLGTIHKASSTAGKYQIDIDKSHLPRGIYLIHIHFLSTDGTLGYKTLKLLI